MFDLSVGLCHRMAAEPWYIPAAKMRSLPFAGTSIPSSPSLSSRREHPWLRGYGHRRVCKDLFCSFSKPIAKSQPTLSCSAFPQPLGGFRGTGLAQEHPPEQRWVQIAALGLAAASPEPDGVFRFEDLARDSFVPQPRRIPGCQQAAMSRCVIPSTP